MTSPVTPIYKFPYLAEGEPFYLIRQRLQAAVDRLEVVLPSTGVAVPGAADLAALAGRVGTLEGDQAAEDTARARQAVTWATGWEQWTAAPYGEVMRAWKPNPDVVNIQGMPRASAAIAAGVTSTMFTLPVGYRPAVTIIRHAGLGGSAAAVPALVRVDIEPTGAVRALCSTAVPIAGFIPLDLSFRTVNT